jgi:hypothetical protein
MKHPHWNHIADLDELMGVFDKFRAKLADVNKTAAIRAEFDEDTEVRDADNQSGKHRARCQGFERRNGATQWNGILEITPVVEWELQRACNG